MKSVKELRKKAAARPRKSTPVYSTSEARANFAEALETAQVESAVVGFDRYGRTVAALVPVEAVYILAGREDMVSPLQRDAIVAGARQFIAEVPNRLSARAEKVARPARATKVQTKKAKKTPKAPVAKRNRQRASATGADPFPFDAPLRRCAISAAKEFAYEDQSRRRVRSQEAVGDRRT
ncbi:MAG: hypothetical protein M0D54_00990 [Hyphomonadaceae bacterium JAD_PAG50586_4]|nr:MAG: hypothetical protein M0D54_00990 [Hyphomonadaceae bacterium JAD_PAG50586_4]